MSPAARRREPAESRYTLFHAIWAVSAAFAVYFCMYGFRKPFTATSYEGASVLGVGFKTVLVTAQVTGYMISKFVGIRVIAEMPRQRRASFLILLIVLAELALVGFGLTPRPWNAFFLFLNGLPLGMVFGLVLGFLEGRRVTEALTAGLCVSFIVADGFTKTVATWLIDSGVSEDWMPAAAGGLFFVPLVLAVLMLRMIKPPNPADVAARSERVSMTKSDRWWLVKRFAPGLIPLVLMFLLVTILRSFRADFSKEIWSSLGAPAVAATFTSSELWVGLGVTLACGAIVLIRNNRMAFAAALGLCAIGFGLLATALISLASGEIDPFAFMVLIGLGLYLPYVAVHTTLFERMLAMTRERGNLGFLMYVADSIGYLGYVAVLLARDIFQVTGDMLPFLKMACWITAVVSLVCLAWSAHYFLRERRPAPAVLVQGIA